MTTKIIYMSQKNNRSWSSDPDAFEGLTYPVVVPIEFMGGAMTYDRFKGEFIPDPVYVRTLVDDIADAENHRTDLLTHARAVTHDWVVLLGLEELEADDKDKLSKWMAYIKKVKALVIDKAIDDIDWPEVPAE